MLVGGFYDFLADVMHAWNFHLTSAYRIAVDGVMQWKSQLFGSVGSYLGEKYRLVWKMDALSAIFGLGYIVGLKYSAIIAAGSVLSFLVLVPAAYFFGRHIGVVLPPATETLIRDMTELQIFTTYVQKSVSAQSPWPVSLASLIIKSDCPVIFHRFQATGGWPSRNGHRAHRS